MDKQFLKFFETIVYCVVVVVDDVVLLRNMRRSAILR